MENPFRPPDFALIRNVLIVRLSSIGDVTHALPVAAALKDAWPHLKVTWLVEEMSAEILLGSSCIDEVIVVPRNRWKREGRWTSARVRREYFGLLRRLRSGQFDLSIDLQGYAKSAVYVLAAGAKLRVGWRKLKDGSNLVSRSLLGYPESLHRVDWFLDVVRALSPSGKLSSQIRFPFDIPQGARSRAADLLSNAGVAGRYAVINPSSGSETRRWSADNYAAVAESLYRAHALKTVLVGSNRDKEICQQVSVSASRLIDEPIVIDLSGETSIKELAAILSACSVHICGDTGSAHIAAALNTPVVALYGPTDPTHAGPWLQQRNVLAHRECCVAGCGVRQCVAPGREDAVAKCLSEITPAEVMSRIDEVLNA